MRRLGSICVYCGASNNIRPEYEAVAIALGQELSRRDIGLVYGGGSVGLMGTLARTAREGGCSVVGVIPESLTTRELMGEQIGELIVVESMHERKAIMSSLSDAFVALPGGFGTMDELFEAITWGQLGIHAKPIGLLNVEGYFDPILQWIERGVQEGFVNPQHRKLLTVDLEPAALIDRLATYEPPPGLIKRLDLDEA